MKPLFLHTYRRILPAAAALAFGALLLPPPALWAGTAAGVAARGNASAAAPPATASQSPDVLGGVQPSAFLPAASSPSGNAATAFGSTPEENPGERMPDGDQVAPPEALFSLTYQACMDAAEGAPTAVQDCMNTELERLERHVEIQRALLAATLPQERAAACREALEAWDTLRKSGSAAMFDPHGGTLSPLAASLWYLEQTARMARWLDTLREVSDGG